MNQFQLRAYLKHQPQQDYRFRFTTEGAKSILYSRNASQPGSKFPAVCLETDAAALQIASGPVTLTVSTVNSEGLIHPYYLVGKGCENGIYRANLDFPAGPLGDGIVGSTVELSNIAIFCVKRNREALKQAIAKRIQTGQIPFIHADTERADEVYVSRISLLEYVHLAFTFYHYRSGQSVKIISEAIKRAPRPSNRQVHPPLVMPMDLPLLPEQKAWLHIEGLAKASNFTMSLTPTLQAESVAEIQHRAVRANLFELLLRFHPNPALPQAERIQCMLNVSDGINEHSAEVFLHRQLCPQCQSDMRRPVPQDMPGVHDILDIDLDPDLANWLHEVDYINAI